jgi:hypothetical protein
MARRVELSLSQLLLLPVTGFVWLLSEIREAALAEGGASSADAVRRLVELEEARELGEVDEAEYGRRWQEEALRLGWTGRTEGE